MNECSYTLKINNNVIASNVPEQYMGLFLQALFDDNENDPLFEVIIEKSGQIGDSNNIVKYRRDPINSKNYQLVVTFEPLDFDLSEI